MSEQFLPPQESVADGALLPSAEEAALAVPWTTRQTWIGVGLTVGPLLLLTLLATLLAARGGASSVTLAPRNSLLDAIGGVLAFGLTSLLEMAFLIAPFYFAARLRAPGTSVWEGLRALGFRRPDWRQAALWIVGAGALIYAAGALYDVVKGPLGLETNTDALARQIASAPLTTLGLLLAGVLVAPFCEEVFFRGFLLPGLARSMPIWVAVVVSSLLFAVAHGDLGTLAPLIVIGLTLGVVRWKTRSLWPCVILHMLNNTAALVALVVLLPH